MGNISKEDAEQIIFAISVAEGEIGQEFNDLKAKLYRLFPKIKTEHEDREQQFKTEADKQHRARREIAEKFLTTVNQNTSILEQVITFYFAHEKEIRDHFSDEICFPFDIWEFANPNLVTKLAGECRTELLKGSESRKVCAKDTDAKMVHGLIRILEDKMFEQRMAKKV